MATEGQWWGGRDGGGSAGREMECEGERGAL